eukprot:246699-Prorocentrum_minimum.AAC.2
MLGQRSAELPEDRSLEGVRRGSGGGQEGRGGQEGIPGVGEDLEHNALPSRGGLEGVQRGS